MKCDWVQQNIIFYVYNELEDDARYEVEQHLGRCPECASELKAARKLHATLSQRPVHEPTPNLLAASRMRLQEALETTTQGGLLQRLYLRASHLAAADSHVPGAGGSDFHHRLRRRDWGDLQFPLEPSNHDYSCGQHDYAVRDPLQIRLPSLAFAPLRRQPGSNQVTIKFDTVSTQDVQGSLSDQRIQQLLLFAARSNYNSGVRMDSVDLLTQAPNETHVREALVYALHNDSNPGVRLKAWKVSALSSRRMSGCATP